MHDVPVLETDRLVLRGHALSDFDECAAMWADSIVTRHIGGRPFTGEEVWTKLLRYVGHWALLGFGYWVVHERATNRFVGEVGLADFRREIEPSFGGAPEMGWALASWAHGKGFATEAVRGVLSWSDERLSASRTVCIIDPGNVASVHVAEKCGYRRVTETTYKGAPIFLFERVVCSPNDDRP
jgi:RimJ/RimL family protein N-acetyltransferase